MNCAWCGAKEDDTDSHGICAECEEKFFPVKKEEPKKEEEEIPLTA